MSLQSSPNLNIAWCRRLVENLLIRGVQTFFVSPGYRDAPLIAALIDHPEAHLISCMDERAAAYMALGYAKAKGSAAALVCTSGTAAANYLPAVVEAATEQLPMIVLSCDRPMELAFTGANQAIDHSSFLAGYSKSYMPLPAPEDAISPRALDTLISVAHRQCHNYPRGVVHINIPLRGRLEPVAESHEKIPDLDQRPLNIRPHYPSELGPDPREIISLQKEILKARRGLLVLGRLHHEQDIEDIYHLSTRLGWPVYADITSSLAARLDRLVDLELPFGYEFLRDYDPDLLVQCGSHITSKYLDRYLEERPDPLPHWIFSQDANGQNPAMTPAIHIAVNHFAWLRGLEGSKKSADSVSPELNHFKERANELIENEPLSMPWVASALLKSGHKQLFLGNSSAIRAFDTWVFHHDESLIRRIFANRGVSGIEGLLASAMGVAIGSGDWVDLVIGDVSMIHDLNSLLHLAQLALPVRVFCLNNGGGGIFKKLAIGPYPKLLNPYIATPHSLNFADVCQGVGLNYFKIDDKNAWAHALSLPIDQPKFFEVIIPVERDNLLYETLKELAGTQS